MGIKMQCANYYYDYMYALSQVIAYAVIIYLIMQNLEWQ